MLPVVDVSSKYEPSRSKISASICQKMVKVQAKRTISFECKDRRFRKCE